ncbi:YaeQ family protein [Bacteriovorax stolpii]|nr:YaeQ family protein [Bacteriovorax stolpii]
MKGLVYAMALKATIHKVRLSVANLNIHHYEDYNLTIAKHPSETNTRMIYRLVAFALLSQEGLEFTKGLSTDEEPDLWKINYDGSIDHWIELGLLEEKRIRQACSKSKKVSLFTYHGNQAEAWFESIEPHIRRFDHLNITHLSVVDGFDIEELAERTMNFDINIDHDELWLSTEKERVHFHFQNVVKSQDR